MRHPPGGGLSCVYDSVEHLFLTMNDETIHNMREEIAQLRQVALHARAVQRQLVATNTENSMLKSLLCAFVRQSYGVATITWSELEDTRLECDFQLVMDSNDTGIALTIKPTTAEQKEQLREAAKQLKKRIESETKAKENLK